METETGKVQKNRYDAEGLRYELIENGRRTSFVYHNGELLHERGGEAGLFQRESSYHLGAGIEAFEQDRKTFYYHQDEQLNTTLITDEERKLRNHYQYDAFGAGLEAAEALPNRIRYTGQQYDEQTGQYYLRARYYNPVLGRFMQEDVYQGDGLNLYAYCHNNPVVYYDPSGYVSVNLSTDCGGNGKLGNEQEEYVAPKPFREDMSPEDIKKYDDFWKTKIDLTQIGPFAGDSIPAQSKSQKFSTEERVKINAIGRNTGCHSCGTTDPGTKSGNFIPDHQPVSNTVPDGTPQVLYPQCRQCSLAQGGMIRARASKKEAKEKKKGG